MVEPIPDKSGDAEIKPDIVGLEHSAAVYQVVLELEERLDNSVDAVTVWTNRLLRELYELEVLSQLVEVGHTHGKPFVEGLNDTFKSGNLYRRRRGRGSRSLFLGNQFRKSKGESGFA